MPEKENLFAKTCKAMGGKYESEYGLVEPDVGFETLHEKEVFKQWCTLGHLDYLPDDFTIFKVPGEVEFQSEMFTPTDKIRFDMSFEEYYDPDKKRMCFRSKLPKLKDISILPGVIHVCVDSYPEKKPTAARIGFPSYETWIGMYEGRGRTEEL